LPASPWHDHGAERLKETLKAAAAQAGADVYVVSGPNDISTPAGIRKPDVFVVPKDVVRSAISRRVRTYYASDLLLVAEVVSPRSGSERTDRVQKVGEYAKAGIPLYWIIELDPDRKSRCSPWATMRTSSWPRSEPDMCSASRSHSLSASTQWP
jgi:Uma2 family endonuclease